jgi:hypothetical protein
VAWGISMSFMEGPSKNRHFLSLSCLSNLRYRIKQFLLYLGESCQSRTTWHFFPRRILITKFFDLLQYVTYRPISWVSWVIFLDFSVLVRFYGGFLTLASGTIWATGFLNRTAGCLNRTSTWNVWEKLCVLKVRHYRRYFRSFGAWRLITFTGPLSGAGN